MPFGTRRSPKVPAAFGRSLLVLYFYHRLLTCAFIFQLSYSTEPSPALFAVSEYPTDSERDPTAYTQALIIHLAHTFRPAVTYWLLHCQTMDTPLPPSNPMYNHPLPLPSTSRTLLPRSRATSLTRSVSSSASASQSRSSSVVPGRVGDRERERLREGEQRRLRARVRARVRAHERTSEMETGGDTEPEGEVEADDVEEMNVGDAEADTEIEDADEPGPPLTQLTEVNSSPPQRGGGRGLDMGMRTIAEESWSQLPAQMSLDRDLSFAMPHPRPLQPTDTLHDIPFEMSTQAQTHMETDTRPLKRKRTASDDGQDEAEERSRFAVPSGSASRSGPSMTTRGGPGSSSYVRGMMGGSSASIGRLRTGRIAMGGPADSSWSEVEGHLGRLSDFISSDEEEEDEGTLSISLSFLRWN